MSDSIELPVSGLISTTTDEKVIMQIRSVLRNGITDITLLMDSSTEIMSAEFITFLVATNKFVTSCSGRLKIKECPEKTAELLTVSGLGELII